MKKVRMMQISDEALVQIYQEDKNTLDKTVSDIVQLLDKSTQKIATAESCTGGLLSQWITSVSGASNVFELGICTYSNRMKEHFLHVPSELLRTYGAVSPQTAQAMAEGLKDISGADLCISVTGLAGPGGGTPLCPVGTVYTGVFYHDRLCVAHLQLAHLCVPERQAIRTGTAVCAFGIARRMLMEESECRM
ncbi:MAG: CinA family protein [Ruminococcus sp.]